MNGSCPHTHQSGQLRIAANGYARWLVCDKCHASTKQLEPVVCEHARPTP